MHVDEDDIYSTLALPKGRNNIAFIKNNQDNSILHEWKNLVADGNPLKIIAADVAAAMIKETTGFHNCVAAILDDGWSFNFQVDQNNVGAYSASSVSIYILIF